MGTGTYFLREREYAAVENLPFIREFITKTGYEVVYITTEPYKKEISQIIHNNSIFPPVRDNIQV
jgi:hypothetical protein